MKKLDLCLREADLNDYLNGAVPGERKAAIENHLKDCGACLEKVVFAYQTVNEFTGKKEKGVEIMKSTWKRNLWLVGAILTFTLSFFVSRFFVQLLVATILMAAKWIFDSVNARILIMIYDAWKKGGEEETSKILKTLNDRMNR